MPAQLTPDGVCQTHRSFAFTPAEVLAAFADAERLATWWGPEGFSNSFEVFEFKPQGRWKFVMHGPDGKSYPNENVFLEVGPARVVIRHVSAPNFTLTVTLNLSGGATQLHWHQAFDDPRVAESIRHIIIPANEQNLDRLERSLSAAAK